MEQERASQQLVQKEGDGTSSSVDRTMRFQGEAQRNKGVQDHLPHDMVPGLHRVAPYAFPYSLWVPLNAHESLTSALPFSFPNKQQVLMRTCSRLCSIELHTQPQVQRALGFIPPCQSERSGIRDQGRACHGGKQVLTVPDFCGILCTSRPLWSTYFTIDHIMQ